MVYIICKFDALIFYQDSLLLNGVLTNSEVWYNVKEEHLKKLESADNDMMRKIFNAHHKTAYEIFFLETSKIPIRFVISKRRLLYLWHILHRDENELVRKVYEVQKIKMTKGDWFEMIQNEKKKFKITLSDEEIANSSKYKFKNMVEKQVNTFAFEYLKEKASVNSKSYKIPTFI